MAEAIVRYVISQHALSQLRRRGLALALTLDVLESPQQRATLLPGRDVLQSLATIDGRRYLVRVIVDVEHDPPIVVTAYRTSKIGKYWIAEP